MINDELILKEFACLNTKVDKINTAIYGDGNGVAGLKSDITGIKDVIGGDQYGNPGIVDRISSIERQQSTFKYVYTVIILMLSLVFDEIKGFIKLFLS